MNKALIPHTGRPKFDFRTSSLDNYKKFRKDYKHVKISVSEWRKIILQYTEIYKEYLLETGAILNVPSDCGKLLIKKKKRSRYKTNPVTGKTFMNLPVDWKKSKELKKKVYIMNYHTDGYFFGWTWVKRSRKNVPYIKYANMWKFQAMKNSKKMLFHYLTVDQKYQHLYKEIISL